MTNVQLGVLFSGVLKFSHSKTCFMSIPESWVLGKTELVVFRLISSQNKETFVSCQTFRNSSSSSEANVFIHAKYADELGLKEKEKVCLQQVLSNIPVVQEMTLEPLTADDWEILELNSTTIESSLMNQIRIVWMNQIFPVWVNNSTLNVKVVSSQPVSPILLLSEHSEVHIVPKRRSQPPLFDAKKDANTSKRNASFHRQFEHLRIKGKTSSPLLTSKSVDSVDSTVTDTPSGRNSVLRALSLLSSIFPSNESSKSLSSSDNPPTSEDFLYIDFEMVLRVLPYSRPGILKQLSTVVQATTVFVSADTYVGLCGTAEVPPCVVATMYKVPPIDQKKEKKATTSSTEESNHKSPSKQAKERQPIFDSVCVTVMVVNSSDEDEFHLPSSLFYSKDAIVVPKELKKCLNLEVSSLVRLVGVQNRPIPFHTLVLHPVTHLPKTITSEMLSKGFCEWASQNNASFVLSDGTFLSLMLPTGQNKFSKHYFFLSLKEGFNQTVNSSSSSLGTLSPDSSITTEHKKDPKYGYIYKDTIQQIQILAGPPMALGILGERPYIQKPEGLYKNMSAFNLDQLGGVKELSEQALECFELWLKLRPISYLCTAPTFNSGCLLICGPKGVGKNALVRALCRKLHDSPHAVSVQEMDCMPLKGKRPDTISRKWDDLCVAASCGQPSLIVLRRLDAIASALTSHEQEAGPDGAYFAAIAQHFAHLVSRIRSSANKVAVVVTSHSTHSLHPSLVKTKGCHVFDNVIEIQPPSAAQRAEILEAVIRNKPHLAECPAGAIHWPGIAARTEGYVALDLETLVDRATHAAWVRLVNGVKHCDLITLTSDDFEKALEGYVPSSLRGVHLELHGHRTWKDVGGLREVKRVVQQLILWPVKYKKMFSKYSLKPQTNMLLYGAPGTGKTLLAGVIASECGLNFISIKGPELLSKYIGASEQAVRDLFKRATSARPCILFFDEFDSIAPRRGHDSTGVTDRVVNQLLTQLDGVESLEGVHVIAASSRPELIDPALLRPGRLDKCLLCPLPDQAERVDILQCLSSKLPLSEEVDFSRVASEAEHFTGADLQALLYTAHIQALHDAQGLTSRRYSATSEDDFEYSVASDQLLYMPSLEQGVTVPSYEEGQKIVQEVSVMKERFVGVAERRRSRRVPTLCVTISQCHLEAVVKDMKPSVSEGERRRYEAIFRDFQRALSGEVVPQQTKQRVTLA